MWDLSLRLQRGDSTQRQMSCFRPVGSLYSSQAFLQDSHQFATLALSIMCIAKPENCQEMVHCDGLTFFEFASACSKGFNGRIERKVRTQTSKPPQELRRSVCEQSSDSATEGRHACSCGVILEMKLPESDKVFSLLIAKGCDAPSRPSHLVGHWIDHARAYLLS